MNHYNSVIFISICSIVCLSSNLFARNPDTLRVPSQYPTIQAGIDAATPGDIVLVAPGVYTGSENRNLDFGGKAIVVASDQGAASTTINCQGSGKAFYFHSGEDSNSVVRGFTIRNGSGYMGGAIECGSTTSPRIVNNIFLNDTAYFGGAIACGNSTPLIVGNAFIGNFGFQAGGAIWCYISSPKITNNSFTSNISFLEYGAIHCADSLIYPIIKNCILYDDFIQEIWGYAIVTYSDILGGWSGIGNIDADPMWVNPPDLHLLWGSPCIDAGDPASPLDPDSTRADMGAFYYDQLAVAEGTEIPVAVQLDLSLKSYPNPCTRSTIITYSIPVKNHVNLAIYDLAGQLVERLLNQEMEPGQQSISWQGVSDVGAGVYFVILETGDYKEIEKLILLR